jgi:hypothetical protein
VVVIAPARVACEIIQLGVQFRNQAQLAHHMEGAAAVDGKAFVITCVNTTAAANSGPAVLFFRLPSRRVICRRDTDVENLQFVGEAPSI